MRRSILAQLSRLAEMSAPSGALQQHAACSTTSRAAAAQYSTVAAEIETLVADTRAESGSLAARHMRSAGKVPGMLFSLPEEQHILLSFDAKAISAHVHRLGRTGWACHVFNVLVNPLEAGGEAKTFRALGRQVHLTSTTDAVENVTLLHCPPDRRVRVEVPLRVFGEEVCPGLKSGGSLNWIKRTISCIADGHAVPASFELDVSGLAMNGKLHYTDLALPKGVQLRVKDLNLPILKIQKK